MKGMCMCRGGIGEKGRTRPLERSSEATAFGTRGERQVEGGSRKRLAGQSSSTEVVSRKFRQWALYCSGDLGEVDVWGVGRKATEYGSVMRLSSSLPRTHVAIYCILVQSVFFFDLYTRI